MSESSIRFERTEGFAVLYNSLVRDPRLSLKTLGLMARIISLPETWRYSVSGLAKVNGVGKDAIRTSLKELEAAGYLTRERAREADGTLGGTVYTISERSSIPLPETPTVVPDVVEAEPMAENPPQVEPMSDKPTLVQPTLDNPTQYNKYRYSKDLSNTPIPPKGGGVVNLFERFWAAYPYKEGKKPKKQNARRAWEKLNPDLSLGRIMSRALERDKLSEQWTRDNGRYIPHAATWLNERRWEDELAEVSQDITPDIPKPRKSHIEVRDGEEVVVFD